MHLRQDFIPDLRGWTIAELRRLSYDVEYRHECYRKADPDLVLVDSLEGTAKTLVNSHGRRIANMLGIRLHQIPINAIGYREIAILVDTGKITNAGAGKMIEKHGKGEDLFAWDMGKLASIWGILITDSKAEINKVIDDLITKNPKSMQDYKAGRLQALGALVGTVIKNLKESLPTIVTDPKDVKIQLEKRLKMSE